MRNVLHVKKTMFIVEGSLLTHNLVVRSDASRNVVALEFVDRTEAALSSFCYCVGGGR